MYTFDDDMSTGMDRPLKLESCAEDLVAVQRLAEQGRGRLALLSRMLEPNLYDTAGFVEAVKRLVVNNRFAEVRIIVAHPGLIVQRGHRLISLAMTLSSFICIKKAARQHKDFCEEMLLIDEEAYFHRLNDSRYEATLNFSDKWKTALLLRQFDCLWAEARTDQNLRRMML